MAKKTILYQVTYTVELDGEDLQDGGAWDTAANKLHDQLRHHMMLDGNFVLQWESTSTKVLNPAWLNCGRCARCGSWVTDREKENPIAGLCNGAMVDGQLLCDEHLPPDHRWAF